MLKSLIIVIFSLTEGNNRHWRYLLSDAAPATEEDDDDIYVPEDWDWRSMDDRQFRYLYEKNLEKYQKNINWIPPKRRSVQSAQINPRNVIPEDLQYFVSYKPCYLLEKIFRNQQFSDGYPVSLHWYANKKWKDTKTYDLNWIYVISISPMSQQRLLRPEWLHLSNYRGDVYDCIVKIDKSFLENPMYKENMMINLDWAQGTVGVDTYYTGKNIKSLYESGQLMHTEEWPTTTEDFARVYAVASPSMVFGERWNKESAYKAAIRTCLQQNYGSTLESYDKQCEFLFRNPISWKYIKYLRIPETLQKYPDDLPRIDDLAAQWKPIQSITDSAADEKMH